MKIYVEGDEWYPVWSCGEKKAYGYEPINVTVNQFAKIKQAFEDFEWAQNLISKQYDKLYKKSDTELKAETLANLKSPFEEVCPHCSRQIDSFMTKQDRKPGLNPHEAAIALGDAGFTNPRQCCPHCREYLDAKV